MEIIETYSHLNGYEFLMFHKPELWNDITQIINSMNSENCLKKISKEIRMKNRILLSPTHLNALFKEKFHHLGWKEKRISFYVTKNAQLIRKTILLTPQKQKEMIQNEGCTPLYSYNQTDFVKDNVAVEVQFGKYSFVAYDLFVKHLAFYMQDEIDVGIEILPMKSMQKNMSSGIAYYEGELYNILRHGRTPPAVPLVLIGIDI